MRTPPEDRRADYEPLNVVCIFDIQGSCKNANCKFLHPTAIQTIRVSLDVFESWKTEEFARREEARVMKIVEKRFVAVETTSQFASFYVQHAHQKIDAVDCSLRSAFEQVYGEIVGVRNVATNAASTAAEAKQRAEQLAQEIQDRSRRIDASITEFCESFTEQLNITLVGHEEKIDAIDEQLKIVQTGTESLQSNVGVLQSDMGVLQSDVGVLQNYVGVLQHNDGVSQREVGILHHNVSVVATTANAKLDALFEQFAVFIKDPSLLQGLQLDWAQPTLPK
jgi:hypothetical protein